jgi:hypothetical protein
MGNKAPNPMKEKSPVTASVMRYRYVISIWETQKANPQNQTS